MSCARSLRIGIRSVSISSRSASSDRRRRSRNPPISTFSRTVIDGNNACDCGTWVIPRRRISSGGSPSVRSPAIVIVPPLHRSSPLITRSTVDLPAPLGPTTQVTVPSAQSRSTPCSTSPPP